MRFPITLLEYINYFLHYQIITLHNRTQLSKTLLFLIPLTKRKTNTNPHIKLDFRDYKLCLCIFHLKMVASLLPFSLAAKATSRYCSKDF